MFEDLLRSLSAKYGDDFNWRAIQSVSEDCSLLNELNSELRNNHPLYRKVQKSVAKCYSNDDVMFLLSNENWAIVHLTYSKNNVDGFPRFKEFSDLPCAMSYIEERFISEFL